MAKAPTDLQARLEALERRVAELEAEAERRHVARRMERALAAEPAPARP